MKFKTRKTSSAEFFQQERQECAHALLNRSWIKKEKEPELFQSVKHHYQDLREWFLEHCGFVLLMTRSFAKLEKVPGKGHAWMGMETFYHPRDYTLFTFCLWYLEGKGEMEQFLLTEMVEEIREHLMGTDTELNWLLYEHRLSMARALKKLRELDVLSAVEGDETDWARHGGEESNVLYECSPFARYVLRRFHQDLTSYSSIESLGEENYPSTPEGLLKRRKHQIFRRLLQEPFVHDLEWTQDERQYVLTQRHYILNQLEQYFGLTGQRYREGLFITYPELTGEMQLFPTARGISDLAVLLASEIRQSLVQKNPFDTDDLGRIRLTWQEFESLLSRLQEQHKTWWSAQYREMKCRDLGVELLEHLTQWNLGGIYDAHHIWLEPALGRFCGHYTEDFND